MAEDSSSWYARKLAQVRGNAPPFQGAARPQPVARYQEPQPRYQEQYAPPAHEPPAPAAVPETFSEYLDMQKHGQALAPGKGGKLNREPCPSCGGSLYYADLGMKRRGPPPAPRCFTCGYNELFEQGLESNWQGMP
jgi:hypothetical protein